MAHFTVSYFESLSLPPLMESVVVIFTAKHPKWTILYNDEKTTAPNH